MECTNIHNANGKRVKDVSSDEIVQFIRGEMAKKKYVAKQNNI